MVSPALLPNTASSIVDQNGRATQEFRDFLIRLGAASDGDLLQHEIDALAIRVAALENAPAIDAIIAGLYSIQSFGSLASGVVQIYLRGDTNNLGPTMVYGTDEESSRAWIRVFDMLSAGAGIEITDSGYRVLGVVETSADIPGTGTVGDAYRVLALDEAGLWAWDGVAWALDAAATGVVGVQLAPLADTGVGAFKLLTRDQYGRLEGTADGTTDDVPEGATNLYFTAARVRATVLTGLSLATSAVIAATDTVLSALGKLQAQITALTATVTGLITQTITDGDTTHAPSGDAVFDALAGKYDKTGGALTGNLVPDVNDWRIQPITVDGADTVRVLLCAGGSPSSGRGGFITLHGNEHAGAGLVRIDAGGTADLVLNGATVRPSTDGTTDCGSAAQRWNNVRAVNGAIVTSDAREKTAVVALTEAEIVFAKQLAGEIGTFQWLEMIEQKGAEDARHHIGVTVQRCIELAQAHGLDPFRYAFICYDEWDETPEQRDEETGEVMQEYRPAGDRYSLRPDQMALFLARGFDARLKALEG